MRITPVRSAGVGLFLAFGVGAQAFGQELCANLVDDDLDGLQDCADSDCGLDPACCSAAPDDADADGWCAAIDECLLVPDPGQQDADGDGTGDACDACPVPGNGLTAFGPTDVVVQGVTAPTVTIAADLDGDGDLDVAALWYYDGTLTWYENAGDGTFGPEQLAATAIDGLDLRAADLDADGDPDLVVGGPNAVSWYENLGSGSFGPEQVISSLVNYAASVASPDLDGDGDADVLAASLFDDTVAWYENLGGTFGPQQLLPATSDGPGAVSGADLDGDGDADVLVGFAWDGEIAWFENLGAGLFGAQQVIGIEWMPGLDAVTAADLDGDGVADVLGASSSYDPYYGYEFGQVTWYPGLGGGTFGSERFLTGQGAASGANGVSAADFDGDADLDVLSSYAVVDRYGRPSGSVAWQENLGGGAFGPLQVVLGEGGASAVAADLDGDGALDVLAATASSAAIRWARNTSGCAQLDADTDGLTDAEEWLVYGTDPLLADTDGDGWSDLDEVAAGLDPLAADSDGDGVDDGLDGCPGVFEAVPLDGDGDGVGDVCDQCPAAFDPTQLDGDGDTIGDACDACTGDNASGDRDADGWCDDRDGCVFVADPDQADADSDGVGDACDVCAGPANGLYLFGNPSHPIGPGAVSAAAGDFDGDGDADVVTGNTGWYPNLGGGVFDALQILGGRAEAVRAPDLDGDGDVDLLVASGTTVGWYENLGAGAFGGLVAITTGNVPVSVFDADLDGDGDLDVLSAMSTDDQVTWSENLGGGAFAAARVVTSLTDGAASVSAVDLDGDGDADVLSASSVDDEVAWYENLGGGAFGAQQIITTQGRGAQAVRGIDLDGDGDADVLSASNREVAWSANLGGGSFGARTVIGTVTYLSGIDATDLDGDGDADVLASNANQNDQAWIENLGAGAFGPRQDLFYSQDMAYSITTADFDGDGDPDVLDAASYYPGEYDGVTWYENLSECYALDRDGDGLSDAYELLVYGTAVANPDTDGDTLLDGEEVHNTGTDPLSLDTDGDGIPDADETFGDTGDTGDTSVIAGTGATGATGETGRHRDSGMAPGTRDTGRPTTYTGEFPPPDTDDPETPPSPKGDGSACGCATGPQGAIGGGAWIVALVPLAALRRRVRR